MWKRILQVCFILVVLAYSLFASGQVETSYIMTADLKDATNQISDATSGEKTNQIEGYGELEKRLLRDQIESYKESVSNLKWAIGSLMVLFFSAIVIIVFKNENTYKDALKDAKNAAREAKDEAGLANQSREKAQDWEQKAREKYESLERHINNKIEEFDDKTKEKFNELDEEAQKQREITGKRFTAFQAGQEKNFELADLLWSEIIEDNPHDYKALYNWANCLCDWARQGGVNVGDRYRLAGEKYKQATQMKPNFAEGFYRWGLSLKQWAENGLTPIDRHLYEIACEKFKHAIDVKSDFALAYYSWANTLFNWARIDEEKAEELFALACDKYQKATEIRPDYQDAFFHWGIVLGSLGLITGRDYYYQSAEEKLLKAEEIRPGCAAYSLACTYAVMHNEEKCRQWLNVAQQKEMLPTYGQVEKNEHLEPYINKDWFKKLWRKEPDLE